MNCKDALEELYEGAGGIALKARFAVHALFCPSCAGKKRRLDMARSLMLNTFMPEAPDISEAVMFAVYRESALAGNSRSFSVGGWVFVGFFILLSLTGAYFGGDFRLVAADSGLSFILPAAITIGGVITAYGAVFIGTHLEELNEKFDPESLSERL